MSRGGKARDLQFFLAPAGARFGEMICGACRKSIDEKTEDFRAGVKSDPLEGWRYVTHHRACLPDDGEFRSLELRRERQAEHNKSLLSAAIAFRDQWQVDNLDDLIEDLSE